MAKRRKKKGSGNAKWVAVAVAVVVAIAVIVAISVAQNRGPKEEASQVGEIIRGTARASSAPGAAASAPKATGAAAVGQSSEFTPCPPTLGKKAVPAGANIAVSLPKTTFDRNEPVPIHLALKNTGAEPLRRRWGQNQPDWDIWVSLNGQVLWRYFAATDARGGAGDRTYAPGEGREIDQTWENVVCFNDVKQRKDRVPGTYTVQGYFTDYEGGWYSNTATFTVT